MKTSIPVIILAVIGLVSDVLAWDQHPHKVRQSLTQSSPNARYEHIGDQNAYPVFLAEEGGKIRYDFYTQSGGYSYHSLTMVYSRTDDFAGHAAVKNEDLRFYEDDTKRLGWHRDQHAATLLVNFPKGPLNILITVNSRQIDRHPTLVHQALQYAFLRSGVKPFESALNHDGRIKVFSDEDRSRFQWEKKAGMARRIGSRMFPRLALGAVGPGHIGPMPRIRFMDDLDMLLDEGLIPQRYDKVNDSEIIPTAAFFSRDKYRIGIYWKFDPDSSARADKWIDFIGLIRHELWHVCFLYLDKAFVRQLVDAMPRDIYLEFIRSWYYPTLADEELNDEIRTHLLNERIAFGLSRQGGQSVNTNVPINYSFPLDFTAGSGAHAHAWNKKLPELIRYLTGGAMPCWHRPVSEASVGLSIEEKKQDLDRLKEIRRQELAEKQRREEERLARIKQDLKLEKTQGEARTKEMGFDWAKLDEVLDKGDKPVILLLTTDEHCQPCRMLEKTLAKFSGYLTQNYNLVRVDIFKERQILDRYPANGYPCMYFLKPGGEIIGQRPGHVNEQHFMKLMHAVRQRLETD